MMVKLELNEYEAHKLMMMLKDVIAADAANWKAHLLPSEVRLLGALVIQIQKEIGDYGV